MRIFHGGSIGPVTQDETGFRAIAEGTDIYEVELTKLGLFCECPYFLDEGICKHGYALLLAIDASSRSRLTAPSKASSAVVRRENWRGLLDRAWDDEDLTARLGEDIRLGEHLVYRISPPPSTVHHALEIEIYCRERKKNGDFTVPKPIKFRRIDQERLPDAADRDIMADLLMVVPEHAAWSGYYAMEQIRSTVHISGPRLTEIARKIVQTGRAFLGSQYTKDHWRPLHWRPDKSAIRLSLQERAPDWVEGMLQLTEGGEIVPTKGAYFIDNRLVLRDETLSELGTPTTSSWIRQLTSGQPVQIPRSDWRGFLFSVKNLKRGPECEMEPQLRPKEHSGTPKPRLRLKFDADSHNAHGELHFLYAEPEHNTEIPDVDGTYIVSEDSSHALIVNQEAQTLARELLRSVGAVPISHSETGRRQWALAVAKFAPAVRTLIENGWEVHAEGKPVRWASFTGLRVSSGIDWFDVKATANFDDIEVDLPAMLDALRNKAKYVRLSDGSLGLLPEEWIQRYAPLASLGKEVDGAIRMKLPQAVLLDALLGEKAEIFTDDAFVRIRGKLRGFSGLQPAAQPRGFEGTMRPYQLEGLAWMKFLEEIGMGGCLADDMGVGKTIQMLALLEIHRERRAAGESLPPDIAVVPKSLLFNWIAEAKRFTPHLRVLDYTGIMRAKEEIAKHDLILTTYGTLRRDIADLQKTEFHTIVLDESQAIKNASSDSAKAARILTGRHRMAMTGTPIENHLGELWSLFEFLNPGLLGPTSAWRAGRTMEPESREWLRKALRPLILRRTKQQVASDLPERSEQVLYCELEPDQRRLYNAILKKVKADLGQRIQQSGLAKSKLHVLEALLRLRQAACHPKLVDEKVTTSGAKFELLLEQLEEVVEEGHKVLVFSQFTSLLALLKKDLDTAKLTYEYLDGQTQDRRQRVERFQSDPSCPIFLLSLKAGGTGLNLTAADYVYLLDPWWNPAVEAQAIDRTHRIGQVRPVFAYRIVARDTIEERILELQNSKRDLAEAILSEDNATLANLKAEDLNYLLT